MADGIKEATQFFKVAILPELLDRWFTRSLVIPPECEPSEYNYRYCKEELEVKWCVVTMIAASITCGFTCHASNYNLLLK